MKTKQTIITLAALVALGIVARAADHADHKHEHKEGHKHEQAAPAKDTYPTDLCIVSGDKLDSMEDLTKYTYIAPDGTKREVRFCCKDCIKSFKKDPAKYLKILDEAAAKKAATKPDAK